MAASTAPSCPVPCCHAARLEHLPVARAHCVSGRLKVDRQLTLGPTNLLQDLLAGARSVSPSECLILRAFEGATS